MQYKGNFHDGSTEEGKRFVEELWFIFCFIYKQEMRFYSALYANLLIIDSLLRHFTQCGLH